MARNSAGEFGGAALRLRAGWRGGRKAAGVIAVLAAAIAPVSAQGLAEGDPTEQVVRVPVRATANGVPAEWSLVATLYRPRGAGPFPVVVLNHGSPGAAWERQAMGRYRPLPQVREFIKRGFVVIAPMRRGYGDTGGDWAERYGTCVAPDYYRAAREGAKDVNATVSYARSLPFVRGDEVLLVGQSAGGIAAMAAASENPSGVVAVINFSGGRGGRPYTHPGDPCVAANMTEAIGKLARTIEVPVLWHYSENDQFFAPRHVKAWYQAFRDAGGSGKLVMQPPFQWDGHGIFGAERGLPIWTAAFDSFLREVRVAPITPPAVIPVAGQGGAAKPARPAAVPATPPGSDT
ncbi:MAG TPA: CocE/NonD family hydrolase [Burkholderiales bacterium]|nr:CocE/NonD family hydrolase [Burkholderiales bacterium]